MSNLHWQLEAALSDLPDSRLSPEAVELRKRMISAHERAFGLRAKLKVTSETALGALAALRCNDPDEEDCWCDVARNGGQHAIHTFQCVQAREAMVELLRVRGGRSERHVL